ncbi:Transglycosylase-like domain-containing protein [Mycolicibacterium neoaurum]|uniref:transglycosylase family protein n=1 Tax=Mycolicibacterium neoaurum TaxID=1795 RepID=UPI00068C203B|nr:transglycosylase family protein [Mycolicibacterium neoaurum]SDD58683.1 Transglycosylase-like domain-containing protein [Mycolicibacterium neoaurum]
MAIHVDVVPDFNRRAVRDTARDIQRDIQQVGLQAGKGFGDQFGAGLQRSSPKIERGLNKVADATGKVRVEQEKLNAMQEKGSVSSEKMVAQHERLAKARRDEGSAARQLVNEMRSLNEGSKQSMSTLSSLGATIGSLGRVGGPVTVAALAAGITGLAGAASAAAGVVGALPAVIGGAAAAFGTLKLATLGFGDALENIRDTDKFNEAIRSLSPAAREAALSLRGLMPAFDQLKNATQDALFANVGPQLQQLSTQFLPVIQQMTTGVAGAFNSMFTGITAELMTPQTSAAIRNITDNVATAFQNIAPAAASMTNAFASLTSTGSNFLPSLAKAAAEAADSFARFITEASQSGQLQQWIQTGLTTMKQLGAATMNVLEAFVSMAPIGEQIMPMIVDATQILADLMPTISSVVSTISPYFTFWAPAISAAADATSSLIGALSPVLSTVNAIADAWAYIRGEEGKRGAVVPFPRGGGQVGGPGLPGSHGVPGFPSFGGVGGAGMPFGIGGIANRGGIGEISQWSGKPVNNGRGGAGGGSAADLNMPVTPYTGDPMSLLQGMPVNAQLYGAAGQVLDAQHRLEQSKAELNALMQSNDATAEQIQDKRNDVARAEREQYEAELRLIEAKQSVTESFTNTMETAAGSLGEIGAALDADLGISKGLPGLADNLVRFLGSLALAPGAAMLAQSQMRNGYQPGSAGKGIFGMMAAGGAFGSQYQIMPGMNQGGTPGAFPGAFGPAYGGGQPYGLPAGTNTGGYGSSGAIFPGWVHALENAFGVKASTYSGHQESDRHEPGYAPNPNGENRGIDWSGPVDAMQRFADYLSTIPGALEQVIWQNPNTGASTEIAGGQSQPGYFSADLGGHQNHVHTRQSSAIPVPGMQGMPQWSADWNAMAQAESGGNWGINTGNGFFGGLQFAPSSWQAAGGTQYAPSADLASPFQQALAAENLLKLQGPGAWPNTFVPGSTGPAPSGMPTGGGGSMLPGAGMPQSAPFGRGPVGGPNTGINTQAYNNPVGGEGFSGLGGLPMAALQAGIGAAGGAGSMFGGQAASAAAQMLMELGNRAVAFGGQSAAIGVSALGETLLPSGDSSDASIGNSWFGRIAGGLAGARPAAPNMAGKNPTKEQQQQGQQSGQPQQQQNGQQGSQVGVNIENYNVTRGEDRAGQDLARHQTAQQGAGKMPWGGGPG